MRDPKTAEDWQLYTSTMKCGHAARALTGALKKAKICARRYRRQKLSIYLATNKAYEEVVAPVASRYRDYGARDAAPVVALDAIEADLRTTFGD